MSEKIDISIVIPAFNEERRLPLFLDRLISYCNSRKETYEIIVINDGSTDKTFEVAMSYKKRYPALSVVKIRRNRGKGYTVKRGFLQSNGNICVFLDADGSVYPEEIERNIKYILDKGYDIFVGSRVLKSEGQVLKVKWYRKLVGSIFNFCIRTILFKDIKDTQCGFKMFRKEIIRPLFSRSHITGFGFDMEILYLANKMGYRIKEGPVSWHHVRGSKINLFSDSLKMFFNILQIRNWHCTPIRPLDGHMKPDEYKYMYELENHHWWFVSHRKLVEHLIKSLKIPSPDIFDAGAGTGGNLTAFSRLGRTTGIDVSEQAVRFCRRRGLKNVILSPVEKIAYADRSFDVITCLDLLEHTLNPAEVMLELKRVLKDNGRIIITVPAFRFLWSQHDEALGHLRRYEKTSLSCDLHEAGLKIRKMGYFFFLSFFAVAPVRIMRKFLVPKQKFHSDTTTLPPEFLNFFLKFLFRVEIKTLNNFNFPLGTTLYAIVSKSKVVKAM
ncbi:MAG: glycosyltransferase [Candidatus Omnitrophota bacterium]|nr:glycosyltransferase [Candidatus Omnitrophota bacterium]MBU2527993.1 glycosyltransferase [bacterium]MBU3930112.1 glycosyltransferase [bacterium]MBU4123725.1 glycosyltransferase [bacterium]